MVAFGQSSCLYWCKCITEVSRSYQTGVSPIAESLRGSVPVADPVLEGERRICPTAHCLHMQPRPFVSGSTESHASERGRSHRRGVGLIGEGVKFLA